MTCGWQEGYGSTGSCVFLPEESVYPHRVVLPDEQRAELTRHAHGGVALTRMLTRARILLRTDQGRPILAGRTADVGALAVNASTVLRIRRQFATERLEPTLVRTRLDQESERAFEGEQEARLIAVASEQVADGADHWLLRLLADELIRLAVVPAGSCETVRRTLKKHTETVAGRTMVPGPHC